MEQITQNISSLVKPPFISPLCVNQDSDQARLGSPDTAYQGLKNWDQGVSWASLLKVLEKILLQGHHVAGRIHFLRL